MFKRRKNKALNLTPLIDVMTTLIIFILIQSSDSPVEVSDNIKLANSEFGESVKENQSLNISLDEISLGEEFTLEIENGNIPESYSHESESQLIESLYKEVMTLRESTDKKELDMNLNFDKRIPSDSVKKVIYTVTMAGVENIYFIGEKK